MDSDNLPALIKTMTAEADAGAVKHAVGTIAKLTSEENGESARRPIVEGLVDLGVLPCLVTLLQRREAKIIQLALECIDSILDMGEKLRKSGAMEKNPYTEELKKAGGQEVLEKLTFHSNTDIFDYAQTVVEAYFAS